MIELFNLLIVHPIINGLLVVYHVLAFLHVPYALGFSIIVLTVLIRLLLYPFTAKQLKASHKMQQLTPHLARIKEQHKNDSSRIQKETMSLYKEHGVNPAAGCVTMLIQLPLIWGIYSVFQQVIHLSPGETVSAINKIAYTSALGLQKNWDTTFFGLPLEKNPSQLLTTTAYLILLVPVVTAGLQFIQSKMMFKKPPATEKKPGEKTMDFATAFQTQSTYIFPVMFGFLSYTFPLGLSLYWNTFTLFGIIQQHKMQKGAGIILPPVIKSAKNKK